MNDAAIKIIPECIINNLKCSTKEEALEVLCKSLTDRGFVKEDFYKQILERERNFPTGLQTRTLGIAIPHANPDHVISDSIAVGILKDTVVFNEMVNIKNNVNVKVIFLLALTNATKHLKVLKKVVEIIKDDESLAQLLEKNPDEICSMLNKQILFGND